MHQVTRVPFHGTQIVTNGDGSRVALKPVCEAIGLDYSGQLQRLKRQPWAGVGVMPIPSAGGVQDTIAIDRRTFTMWLATIDTSRVKDQRARDLIITFQTEAADALDSYFHEGGALNPNATEHQVNALIRQAQMQIELCQAARGLIHPDHLEAKARIVLARGLGEQPEIDPAHRPLYVQDYLRGLNLSKDRLRRVSGTFGKALKRAYIDLHGVEPGKYYQNMSNGQVRSVYAYTEADRPLMDRVWREKCSLRAGEAA